MNALEFVRHANDLVHVGLAERRLVDKGHGEQWEYRVVEECPVNADDKAAFVAWLNTPSFDPAVVIRLFGEAISKLPAEFYARLRPELRPDRIPV